MRCGVGLRGASQMTLPTIYTFFPYLRQILIRERVDIVHGHQTTSTLAHESLLHAATMVGDRELD